MRCALIGKDAYADKEVRRELGEIVVVNGNAKYMSVVCWPKTERNGRQKVQGFENCYIAPRSRYKFHNIVVAKATSGGRRVVDEE